MSQRLSRRGVMSNSTGGDVKEVVVVETSMFSASSFHDSIYTGAYAVGSGYRVDGRVEDTRKEGVV